MSTHYRNAMKPNFKYVKTVANAFHISNVILVSGDQAKLFLTVNAQKFEAASLTRAVPRKNLNLNFHRGDQIIFHVVGKGEINLEGHLLSRNRNEADCDDGYEDEEDDDVDIVENDEAYYEETDDSSIPNLPFKSAMEQPIAFGVPESVMHPPPRKRRRMSLELDNPNGMEVDGAGDAANVDD